jgi:hypothetical protein
MAEKVSRAKNLNYFDDTISLTAFANGHALWVS